MKTFKFEITVTEEDLVGDEFWEDATESDGTGIIVLTETLETLLDDSNLLQGSGRTGKEVLKLTHYNE